MQQIRGSLRPNAHTSFLIRVSAAAVLLLAVAGCEVGPHYRRPAVTTPPAFGETLPWKVAVPEDVLPKSAWWQVFGDPILDDLERRTQAANPDLAGALARVEQAQAAARVSLAALLPDVGIDATGYRRRYSGNSAEPPGFTVPAYTANSIDVPLELSYEVDLFGQARRELEQARALAEAQAAAYNNVLLSLQAEVAEDYFTWCGLLTQRRYLEETVGGRRQELDLVRKRQRAGAADLLDVYQAEAELTAVENSELAVDQQVEQLRHALAILVGRPPEGFSLGPTPLGAEPPAVPVGLPSDLLERRPDVAQAERNMAAASAAIGVAKAAFFPRIGLTAAGGFNSTTFSTLFQSNSREWYLAPFVTVPLFQPADWADYLSSKHAYEAAVDDYRSQVLSAFRDVDDALSNLRYLEARAAVTQESVAASQKAAALSLVRYKQGITDYFEVIDAERTMLDNQIQSAQLESERFVTTVLLIKALGGGWSVPSQRNLGPAVSLYQR